MKQVSKIEIGYFPSVGKRILLLEVAWFGIEEDKREIGKQYTKSSKLSILFQTSRKRHVKIFDLHPVSLIFQRPNSKMLKAASLLSKKAGR